MDSELIRTKLIEVIVEIQSDSGYEAPAFPEDLCPGEDLEGFDSLIWPAAIDMVSQRLDMEIAPAENLFVSKDGRRFLTIGQIVSRIHELAEC